MVLSFASWILAWVGLLEFLAPESPALSCFRTLLRRDDELFVDAFHPGCLYPDRVAASREPTRELLGLMSFSAEPDLVGIPLEL